jgi:predicted acylesterase/phospholipase RssA
MTLARVSKASGRWSLPVKYDKLFFRMPKKLAVTIAGAVSLGSYEAGVLWEVLDAVKQHNLSKDTAPDDRIVIDVITGASAGGMTAVILAQKLLYTWIMHTISVSSADPLG